MSGVAAKHKTVEESKKVCEQMRHKKDSMMQSLHHFAEIITAETLLKELPKEISHAKEDIEKSTQEFGVLQPKIQEQTDYNTKIKAYVDSKEIEMISLRSKVDELQSRVDRYEKKSKERERLSVKARDLAMEKEGVVSRIKELGPEVEQLKESTSSLQAKRDADQETVNIRCKEKEELQHMTEELLDDLNKLGGVESHKRDLATTKQNNKEVMDKIEQIGKTFETDNQQLKETLMTIETITEESSMLDKAVSDLISRAESLQQSVVPKKEVDGIKNQLDVAIKEHTDAIERITQIEQEIEDHLQSKGGIIKEVEDMRTECKAMEAEFKTYAEEVEMYENDPAQLDAQKSIIPELEKERDNMIKKKGHEQERLAHLNSAADILTAELNEYKNAMAQIKELLKVK